MNSDPVSKAVVALRSAMRSAWPIVVTIAGLVQSGFISLREVFSAQGLISIIVAMGSKGLVTGATAKSVDVKRSAKP